MGRQRTLSDLSILTLTLFYYRLYVPQLFVKFFFELSNKSMVSKYVKYVHMALFQYYDQNINYLDYKERFKDRKIFRGEKVITVISDGFQTNIYESNEKLIAILSHSGKSATNAINKIIHVTPKGRFVGCTNSYEGRYTDVSLMGFYASRLKLEGNEWLMGDKIFSKCENLSWIPNLIYPIVSNSFNKLKIISIFLV